MAFTTLNLRTIQPYRIYELKGHSGGLQLELLAAVVQLVPNYRVFGHADEGFFVAVHESAYGTTTQLIHVRSRG